MRISKFAAVVAAVGLSTVLISCEGVLNEEIDVPEVDVQCGSTKCSQAAGMRDLYVYITQSTCADPFYGSYITGTGTVSCTAGSCTGEVSEWSRNSQRISRMNSGTYSVCALVDLLNLRVPDESYKSSGNAKITSQLVISEGRQEITLSAWFDIP